MIGFSEIKENSSEATEEHICEINNDLTEEREKHNELKERYRGLHRHARKILCTLWHTRAAYCKNFNAHEYFISHVTNLNYRDFVLKMEAAAIKCKNYADLFDDRPIEERKLNPDIIWTYKEKK